MVALVDGFKRFSKRLHRLTLLTAVCVVHTVGCCLPSDRCIHVSNGSDNLHFSRG